jgi:hypothetical protein
MRLRNDRHPQGLDLGPLPVTRAERRISVAGVPLWKAAGPRLQGMCDAGPKGRPWRGRAVAPKAAVASHVVRDESAC